MRQGELLGGRYEVGEVIGLGGMGEVRAGRDLRLDRPVALKRLRAELAGQADVRHRFENEARAAARLSHPHVVTVHDVGEDGGVPFIVMERVMGRTLHDEMLPGPMDEARVRQVGLQVLDALAAAHAAGILHRDVKPGNILLGADGCAKVADFGIAKAIDDSGDGTADMDLTGANHVLGTVAYLAPERLAGEAATVQSDLYSVGVVLYEALAGRRPFAGDTPIGVAAAIHNGRPEPLAQLRPDVDPTLVATTERAMSPRLYERFTSAPEMAASLRTPGGAAAGIDAAPTVRSVPATEWIPAPATPAPATPAPIPPDRATPARPRPRSVVTGRRTWWALAVVAVAALLAVAAAGVNGSPGGRGTPETSGTPAATPGVPAPLADALDRLEGTVR